MVDSDSTLNDSLRCLFCRSAEMLIYWLPDSEPKVCHVACRCGASGSWAESITEATEKWKSVGSERIAQIVERMYGPHDRRFKTAIEIADAIRNNQRPFNDS